MNKLESDPLNAKTDKFPCKIMEIDGGWFNLAHNISYIIASSRPPNKELFSMEYLWLVYLPNELKATFALSILERAPQLVTSWSFKDNKAKHSKNSSYSFFGAYQRSFNLQHKDRRRDHWHYFSRTRLHSILTRKILNKYYIFGKNKSN